MINRVLIVGCPGAGKSTAARSLAKITGLPIIHLDFSTPVCFIRALRRSWTGLGELRGEEFVEGCPERLDLDFLRFVLKYRRGQRKRDLERLSAFRGDMHRFTSPRKLRVYLENLEE